MSNSLKIRKIPLLPLIQMLVYVFDKGVQYVDIVGTLGEGDSEDTLGIVEHAIEPQPPIADTDNKIDDENLNQLI